MAQQPVEEVHHPSTYRELHSAAAYQGGKPDPTCLLASYRFSETACGGERPTPASLIEQTLAFSERRSMTFLCLLRITGNQTEVRVFHRMIRYLELPGAEAGSGSDMSMMGLLGNVSAVHRYRPWLWTTRIFCWLETLVYAFLPWPPWLTALTRHPQACT